MSSEKIVVALDGMGGDNPPYVSVKATQLISEDNIEILLVGDKDKISPLLKDKRKNIALIDCKKFISMEEKISTSLLKEKENTMRKILFSLKEKKADVAVSAGNTAVFVTYAISELRMIKGVDRPAIAVLLPNTAGSITIFLDVGANVNTKPLHLFQSALMGSLYARIVFNMENPKVGLLNIGGESTKGDELRREAYKKIEENKNINFIGNIEGQELFIGKADVVITDGFTGNVVLKVSEGITRSFKTILIKELKSSISGKIGILLVKENLRKFAKKADYAEYGGGVLLGVNGNVIISHGRSSPRALYNAIKLGERIVQSKFLEKLKSFMEGN